MEITGKLIQVLNAQSINGKNGPLTKQEFVIETGEKFKKNVCLTMWGAVIDTFNYQPGETITVSFDLSSREYNGKWYTEAKAWKVQAAEKKEEMIPGNSFDEQVEAVRHFPKGEKTVFPAQSKESDLPVCKTNDLPF